MLYSSEQLTLCVDTATFVELVLLSLTQCFDTLVSVGTSEKKRRFLKILISTSHSVFFEFQGAKYTKICILTL